MCGIAAMLRGVRFSREVPLPWTSPRNCAVSESLATPNGEGVKEHFGKVCKTIRRRGPDSFNEWHGDDITIAASLLSLRGKRVEQPVLSEKTGNVLAFNGQIYTACGALTAGEPESNGHVNDTLSLLDAIDRIDFGSDSQNFGHELLRYMDAEHVRGPWSFVLYQRSTHRIYFARDPLGRRSLMVSLYPDDDAMLIASVPGIDELNENRAANLHAWHELAPVGLCFVDLGCRDSESAVQIITRNEQVLEQSSTRTPRGAPHLGNRCYLPHTMRRCEIAVPSMKRQSKTLTRVPLDVESELVRRLETAVLEQIQDGSCGEHEALSGRDGEARLAVLFSGGLDSMVLAALIDDLYARAMHTHATVDLINVCFGDGTTFMGPDRESALAGHQELEERSTGREFRVEFRLLLVNVSAAEAMDVIPRVAALTHPMATPMDRSIGSALFFAAQGAGVEARSGMPRVSRARVLISGLGADELMGGYKGRHRTVFKRAGACGLAAELDGDLSRLWWRNLGRDDRLVGDHGKEARHPFLDENVIRFLCQTPLTEICDLELEDGVGDKKVLRTAAASILGLSLRTSCKPKRAMQFGSNAKKYLEGRHEYKDFNT
ncbi:Asparagine synthetase domain-containing protein 1 [Porphyridium purpureum]|uniref:Asparagine synthetase domain-containing protein 1 n=1 Tax=Porphyridium purpureum TaxID=35688 RepID=A0A5J4YQ55_PORPP|nr:Asparagine synthetase domain-containing protein 1 [Porphyridium purpureum]|eukprot:POR5009..scf236_6